MSGHIPTGRSAHRPRTEVDELAIRRGHARGASITALAELHDVSRDIIRRVINDEPEPERSTVVRFPSTYAPIAPAGHVTSFQMLERAGMTYRQLDWWTRSGYLHAAKNHPGSGTARFYPLEEVHVAALVARLLDAGLSPSGAFLIARELVTTGSSMLAGIRIDLPEEH